MMYRAGRHSRNNPASARRIYGAAGSSASANTLEADALAVSSNFADKPVRFNLKKEGLQLLAARGDPALL